MKCPFRTVTEHFRTDSSFRRDLNIHWSPCSSEKAEKTEISFADCYGEECHAFKTIVARTGYSAGYEYRCLKIKEATNK
jgi:hypothetical protein